LPASSPDGATGLRARDVMRRAVLSVGPRTSIAALEDYLVEHRVSGVAVVENGRLIGVVSRADVVRALSLGRALEGLLVEGITQADLPGAEPPSELTLPADTLAHLVGKTVRDVMSAAPVTIDPDTSIRDAARLMVDSEIHRLFVIDSGTLAGVLTSLDLAREIAVGHLVPGGQPEVVSAP
jgi:CBS domain-containing protein